MGRKCKVEMTHIRNNHHFLGHNVVQDEGESHLIIIIQQRVDGFLQPHQPVLLLDTHTHTQVSEFIETNERCDERRCKSKTNDLHSHSPPSVCYHTGPAWTVLLVLLDALPLLKHKEKTILTPSLLKVTFWAKQVVGTRCSNFTIVGGAVFND